MGVLQGEFSRIFHMGVQVVFGGDFFRDFRSVAGSVRIPVCYSVPYAFLYTSVILSEPSNFFASGSLTGEVTVMVP